MGSKIGSIEESFSGSCDWFLETIMGCFSDEGGMEMGGFSGPWSGVKPAFFIFCTDFGSENSRSEPLKLIFGHPKSP